MRIGWLVGIAVLAGCAFDAAGTDATGTASREVAQLTPSQQHGRDVWMTSTFGGEAFFSEILPAAPFDLPLGLDVALTTPRAQRFAQWGLINDPDCTDGDASTGFFDRCPDPNATGVVGVRRFANPAPTGPRVLIGIACAACHAGFDPAHPPADPAEPTWDNIDPTIGNQYLQAGKIFAAHLPPSDPRWQVFHTWVPGTVDTTAIENDHINDPGTIPPIYDMPERPFFTLHQNGAPIVVHRSGQGGEDDAGCETSALRVYFNIGMCAQACMVGHLANGPGGTQTPIDLAQCERDCPQLPQAEAAVPDLCAFLNTRTPPALPAAYIDQSKVAHGRAVFLHTCAGCHSNGQPLDENDLTDDQLHLARGPFSNEAAGEIGTNRCRALTTNWQGGHIWAAFSSDEQKARGPGSYRDIPLVAAWATAPFFHNNRLGAFTGDPSIAGRLAAFDDSMHELLDPWTRDFFGSIDRTTASISIPTPIGPLTLPAGTPVNLFANLDPANPLVNLCPDLIENEGHYFGALLSPADKHALIEFLKTR